MFSTLKHFAFEFFSHVSIWCLIWFVLTDIEELAPIFYTLLFIKLIQRPGIIPNDLLEKNPIVYASVFTKLMTFFYFIYKDGFPAFMMLIMSLLMLLYVLFHLFHSLVIDYRIMRIFALKLFFPKQTKKLIKRDADLCLKVRELVSSPIFENKFPADPAELKTWMRTEMQYLKDVRKAFLQERKEQKKSDWINN